MTMAPGQNEPVWKSFLRRHWAALAIFVIVVASLVAWAVYVFLWFVANAETTGLVPTVLAFWTMADFVGFALHAVFWELILVGIPLVIGGVVVWQWWKRLPSEERLAFHGSGKGASRAGGGGVVSFLFFVAFSIKVYLDGRWNSPISFWTVDYVVGSVFTMLLWAVIVIGIPGAVVAIWWFNREMKKGRRTPSGGQQPAPGPT
jgi:hypothetical protein